MGALTPRKSVTLALSELADDPDERAARDFAERCITEARRQSALSFDAFMRAAPVKSRRRVAP